MNYNYPGSVSEYDMHFASSVEVIVDEKNELFNAVSIYIPMSLAAANIADFDPAWVSAQRPAVFTCVLDNYKNTMKGKLLDQWGDVFRQDTNVSVILYLIVFLDDDSTVGMWEIEDVSISFAPITHAFNKLHFISYTKVLFDGDYDGRPVELPADPGTPASAVVRLSNSTGDSLTVDPASYLFNDGVKDWTIPVAETITIPDGGHRDIEIFASTVGADAALAEGTVDNSDVSPAPPVGLVIAVTDVAQGTDPSGSPVEVPSKYFDMSLALAYRCKLDLKLSYFMSLVKISYVDQKPNPEDLCGIRLKTSAEEKEAMLSVKDGDRTKYYWGALFLMGCFQNTWVLVHSEPVNIIALIFAAWFAERNASGQFVGNKMSRLRLRGPRIKPCGFPSWLNSEVNENDRDGIELLRGKNIGFLRTIADNTPQESSVDSAKSLDGTPIAATMISKFVDYTSAQQCAKFTTADSTVAHPVLLNEQSYTRVQEIVSGNLLLFVPTKRIGNIKLKFPPFASAKSGLNTLEAASAWSANYIDDLGEVTVTGGIQAV
jgi:hypothetical protein